jgi:hypothetical protein
MAAQVRVQVMSLNLFGQAGEGVTFAGGSVTEGQPGEGCPYPREEEGEWAF